MGVDSGIGATRRPLFSLPPSGEQLPLFRNEGNVFHVELTRRRLIPLLPDERLGSGSMIWT